MSESESVANKLYFGDNLDILREHVADESVDLIYLDPPFNSNATYNVLFRERSGDESAAQITAFEDTWRWDIESEIAFREVVTDGPYDLGRLLQSMREFLGQNDMMAYLTMMSQRLIELRRVLKSTGSIYLHCDPTASHYLKLMMDSVFGNRNFRNEIVWCYGGRGMSRRWFNKKHDDILFYSKTDDHFFDRDGASRPIAPEHVGRYNRVDEEGRRYARVINRDGSYSNIYLKSEGVVLEDWWNIPFVRGNEYLGYPTQKPLALLERIINASSKEGDVVLDPFCGCGTAVAAAEKLNRRWIGIDITHLAVSLIRHRLQDSFGDDLKPYEVIGDPKDLASAEALAQQNRYQFEWWALGLVDARPANNKRKGADSGVDGYINFFDDNSGKSKRIIVQVKSGRVNRGQIATLKGDMEREGAEIGLFVTLSDPTEPMRQEALSAGVYEPEYFPGHHYARVQILTISDLLSGHARSEYPRVGPESTFRQASRHRAIEGTQSSGLG